MIRKVKIYNTLKKEKELRFAKQSNAPQGPNNPAGPTSGI